MEPLLEEREPLLSELIEFYGFVFKLLLLRLKLPNFI
jgi:hypothetical protein